MLIDLFRGVANIRSAPGFQLWMMPFRSLLMIASSDDGTMAMKRRPVSSAARAIASLRSRARLRFRVVDGDGGLRGQGDEHVLGLFGEDVGFRVAVEQAAVNHSAVLYDRYREIAANR
ncbi:MAG: hypothetical protein QM742_07705 [Aquabacterium sp.]